MLIVGVVNVFPEPTIIPPPVGVAIQLTAPALAVAPNITVPVPQRLAGVVEVIVGIGFIVAVTAVLGDEHPLAVAST